MGIPTADGREWMTINEAAGFLCVSRRTIYNWLAAKRFQTKPNYSGKRQLLLVDRKAYEQPDTRESMGLSGYLMVGPQRDKE